MENYEMEGLKNIAKRISGVKEIRVVFTNDGTCTDGKTISISKQFRKNKEDIYGLVSHEAGHIGYYSFCNMLKGFEKRFVNKYNIDPPTVHAMINVLEDCRVDLINKKVFPGFYKMIRNIYFRIRKEGEQTLFKDLIYYVQGFSDFPFNYYKLDEKSCNKIKKIKKVMNSGFSPAKTVIAMHLLAHLIEKNKDNFKKNGKKVYDPSKKSMSSSGVNIKSISETHQKAIEKVEKVSDDLSLLDKEEIEELADDIIEKTEKDPKIEKTEKGKEEEKEEEKGKEEEKEEEKGKESGKSGKDKGKEEEKEEEKGKGEEEGEGKGEKTDDKEDKSEGAGGKGGEMWGDDEEDFGKLLEEDFELLEEDEDGDLTEVPLGKKELVESIEKNDDDCEKMITEALKRITYSGKAHEKTIRKVKEELVGANTTHHNSALTSVKDIISNNLLLIRKMESYFTRLRAEKRSNNKRSGRLNRSVVRTIATNYEFDRCFTKRTRENTPKITLMVDISGSMNMRKLEAAKTAMVLFEESLKKVANLRIVLFCGTRNATNIVFKDFNKDMVISDFDKFGQHKSERQNIDGTSIKYEAMNNKRGVIIVISDGQPAGTSYGLEEAIPEIREAARVVKKIFAFSIDATGEYLDRMYGRNYMNVNSADKMDLTNKILKFSRMIITNLYK